MSTTLEGSQLPGCVGTYAIPNPLYEHLNLLPMYAGLSECEVQGSEYQVSSLPDPPIYTKVLKALDEISKCRSCTSKSDVEKIRAEVCETNTLWKVSLSQLNLHIRRTGETGFRLNSTKILEIEANQSAFNTSWADVEHACISEVDILSLILFYRQMPRSYDPLPAIPTQPEIESVISSELQRLMSLTLISADRHRDDSVEFHKSELIAEVAESMSVIGVAKQIDDILLSNGFSSLVDLSKWMECRALFDDFEAVFYVDAAEIVFLNGEMFGMMRHTVKKLLDLPLVDHIDYEARSAHRIISSNTLEDANSSSGWIPSVWDEIKQFLVQNSLFVIYLNLFLTIYIIGTLNGRRG